ncbi:uncharacterized protein [Periplaneta americana]|uniref:uncharacterized protein n=1 Tax=Periplaneta americana TaxID=6978 RepID=UPI0037E8A17A
MLIESGSYWLYYQENVYKLIFDLDIEELTLRREVWTYDLLEAVKTCLESNDTTSRVITTKYLTICSKTEYLTRQNKILALHQLKSLYRFPVLCPVSFIFTVTPRNIEDTTDRDDQQQLQQHSLLSNMSRCEDFGLRRSRSCGSLTSVQQVDAKWLTGLKDKLLSSNTNKTPSKCVVPEAIASSTCNTSSPECHSTQEQCIASTPSRSVPIRKRKVDASCSTEDDSPPRKKPLIQSDQPSEDASERLSCKHNPISSDGQIVIKCSCGKSHCLKKQCSPLEDNADNKSTMQASLSDRAHNSPFKKADNDILKDRTNHLKNFIGECTEKYHLCKNHQIVALFGVVCTEEYCKAHDDDVNIKSEICKFGMVPGHNNKKHDISDLLIDACNGEVDLGLMCEARRCCNICKCTIQPGTASDVSHDSKNMGSRMNATAHDSEVVCSTLHTVKNVATSEMNDIALEISSNAQTVPAMECEEHYSQADSVTFSKNMPGSEECRTRAEETAELVQLCSSDNVIEAQLLPNKNCTSLSSSSGSSASVSSSSTSVAASASTCVPVSSSTNVPMPSGTSVSEIVGPSPACSESSTKVNRQATCNESDKVVYPRPLDYSQVLTRRQFETHVKSCEGKRYLDVADILSSSQTKMGPDLRTRSMKGTSVNVIKLLQDMMNYPTVVLQRIDEVLNLSINPPSRKR